MSKKIVILGAGPTGLSAGWQLAKDGVHVDILEKDELLGGLCHSVSRDGYIFDLGGHRFITKDEMVQSFVENLMGDELVVRPRKSRIRLQGKFFDYPLNLKDALTKMPPGVSLRSFWDFILTKAGAYRDMPDVSFENWVVKRFGRTMYALYFGPYSHKLWGIPPSEISANWAAQRISLINITDVLLRALGKKKDMPKTYAQQFLYPKEGIGQIADYMARDIELSGGTVHRNARVTKIVRIGDRIEKIIYEQDAQQKEISGDHIISTIPLPEFILAMGDGVDLEVQEVAWQMSFRSLRFLHIMVDREIITDDTWLYVPEEEYLFFRIQNRRNWSPTTVPEGKNALTLEIACDRGDDLWQISDDEMFERCMPGLESLGFITRSEVRGYFSESVEHAYPLYTLDYNDKVRVLYTFLAGLQDVMSIGRQGLFRYNNMDHSLKMGLLAAKHITEGYSKQEIFDIATESVIFDWHDEKRSINTDSRRLKSADTRG